MDGVRCRLWDGVWAPESGCVGLNPACHFRRAWLNSPSIFPSIKWGNNSICWGQLGRWDAFLNKQYPVWGKRLMIKLSSSGFLLWASHPLWFVLGAKWKWSRPVVSDSLRPMACILPVSSIHGIFQAGVLEWVVISFSRGSSRPRDWTWVSLIAGRRFTLWATREALGAMRGLKWDVRSQSLCFKPKIKPSGSDKWNRWK